MLAAADVYWVNSRKIIDDKNKTQ